MKAIDCPCGHRLEGEEKPDVRGGREALRPRLDGERGRGAHDGHGDERPGGVRRESRRLGLADREHESEQRHHRDLHETERQGG